MKRINTIFIIILLLIGGCGKNKKSGNKNDNFVTVDVTASYPKKELILQDFVDVEYIALETSDEFLCDGRILDIGKDIILVKNENPNGDIFVFDRNGKAIRKINRRGKGGEEYLFLFGVVLDEEKGEMFVNDVIGGKVIVYDLYGNFIRSFPYNEEIRYDNIYNFDEENLICDIGVDREIPDKSQIIIISKQDGSIVDKILIPYEQKKSTVIGGNSRSFMMYPYSPLLPFDGTWILSEVSADTMFRLLPDYSMIPFMTRTPSVQSMSPETFLFLKILTERYYFMEKVKKENSFTKTDLVYDKKENTIYEYTLYNGDYSSKQPVNLVTAETKNDDIVFWQKIEAYTLVNSYKQGNLKSKLKEIAAELEETSNPVIMLVKNKR